MKVKSLKIKISNTPSDVIIPDFISNNNEILGINAEIKEVDGQYFWFVLIAYEPKYDFISGYKYISEPRPLPARFKEEVIKYTNRHKNLNTRVKNCVKFYLEELIEMKKLDDFKRLRGMGVKSIFIEELFLLGLLEVIKKFQYD
jgi:hypothetical protein